MKSAHTSNVSDPPVLLGITKWLTWVVRPLDSSNETESPERHPLSTVFLERLMELAPRLQERTPMSGGDHQLVRFNLLNLGSESVTVSAVALRGTAGQILHCEVVPPVVVPADVRYPFMFELRAALGSADVEVQVEQTSGQRAWVLAPSLPRL
jgi:hypothetical protein